MNPTETIAVSPTRSRWPSRLILTVLINLGSAFMFPQFIADGFSWPSVLACLAPIIWAANLLFRYRTLGERIVSHAAIVLALFWMVQAIGLGVEFFGYG